ncbi:MAG TPA: peroxiredoxin [Acidimicrobiales bacterium]|nr:peroxiredoxin [Acidimicrobiales bacterium]
MSKLTIGDIAPDFTVAGTDGTTHRPYTLSDYRGQAVVLVFYPADNSPVCTVQLGDYNDHFGELAGAGAQVLALSPQSIESHDKFHKGQGPFGFPLLADVDKAVGSTYGILGPLGFYRRSIFVVGPTGVIGYAHRSVTSLSFQPAEAIIAAVENTR